MVDTIVSLKYNVTQGGLELKEAEHCSVLFAAISFGDPRAIWFPLLHEYRTHTCNIPTPG